MGGRGLTGTPNHHLERRTRSGDLDSQRTGLHDRALVDGTRHRELVVCRRQNHAGSQRVHERPRAVGRGACPAGW